MSEQLRIKEFEWADVPLDVIFREGRLDVNPSAQNKDFYATRLTREGVQVQARGYVGIIPLNDRLTLEVVPRVGMSNLSRLVEVSGVPPRALADVMRRYRTGGALYPSLISLYADGLHHAISEIVTRGMMREYEWREETSSFPRGRILIGRTMQRAGARGASHEAAFGWFQRSTDIGVNRCLLYATWRLAHYNRQAGEGVAKSEQRRVARQLNRCMQLLQGVHLDPGAAFMSDPLVTGRAELPTLRGYYRPALDLALTIIAGHAVDIEDQNGNVRLPSLVLDMSSVFEAYLRRTLQRTAENEGWGVRVMDGNLLPTQGAAKPNLLDTGPQRLKATPDIVIEAGPRRRPVVPVLIEVKYKPADRLVDRADLNQTISYGVSYRAKSVVIVQPSDGGVPAGWRDLGTLAGMSIAAYTIDLSAADMIYQETLFADAVKDRLRVP